MIYTKQTKLALSLCYEAHDGQKDHAGTPYVFHPIHLAEQMDTEDEVCCALLHDVVEDTDLAFNDLIEAGFSKEVLEAVSLLTHDRGRPYMDYILGLRQNPLARKVKIADLIHNSDYNRLNRIRPSDRRRHRKYGIALAILMPDRADGNSGCMIKKIPLCDEGRYFLEIRYRPGLNICDGRIITGPDPGDRLLLTGEALAESEALCRKGPSLPELLADYLTGGDPGGLPAFLKDLGIPLGMNCMSA